MKNKKNSKKLITGCLAKHFFFLKVLPGKRVNHVDFTKLKCQFKTNLQGATCRNVKLTPETENIGFFPFSESEICSDKSIQAVGELT